LSLNNNKKYIKKDILCKYGCRTPLKFDPNMISASGKKIPLNLDGTAHECSNRPYNNGTRSCYYCSGLITFSDSITAESGKRIPLNPDSSLHDCRQCNYHQTNQNPTTQVQEIDTTVPLLAGILEQLKVVNEWLEYLSMDKSPKDWESKYK
jgi:hypothetical protein